MLKLDNLKLVFSVVVLFLIGCEQTTPEPEELISREQQRIEYLVTGELDQLANMLSPTLSYTHSNSVLENKQEFLQAIRDGELVYRSLDHQDMDVRFISPKVALLNGISDVVVTADGEDVEVPLRFSVVYVQENGRWMFESWHSVRRQP